MVLILGIVGSPRKNGNTELVVNNALKAAASMGAKTEILLLAENKVQPCIACGTCGDTGECIIDDDFKQVFNQMASADALIMASPSYFESMTPQMKALIDRTGYYNSTAKGRTVFDGKVAGAISVARRTGLANVWTQQLLFILSQKMIVPGITSYANAVGSDPGDVLEDEEGMRTSRELGIAVAELAMKLQE
ncbi:flavodoxin family protein [Candidatus Bathyarchaeota archaeon]|nr:flavodoxin family protein [Candidatus Bathyarchaeota archaeon]